VYPTLQFLYSHHVNPKYISQEVRDVLAAYKDPKSFCAKFLASVEEQAAKG
jgi:hypothetical protein